MVANKSFSFRHSDRLTFTILTTVWIAQVSFEFRGEQFRKSLPSEANDESDEPNSLPETIAVGVYSLVRLCSLARVPFPARFRDGGRWTRKRVGGRQR